MMAKDKTKIIDMIAQGLTDSEVSEASGASRGYVSRMRWEYNRMVPPEQRMRSRRRSPRLGTIRRLAYDYILANPDHSHSEIQRATGVQLQDILAIKIRYFGYVPTREPKHNTMQAVTLSDLHALKKDRK